MAAGLSGPRRLASDSKSLERGCPTDPNTPLPRVKGVEPDARCGFAQSGQLLHGSLSTQVKNDLSHQRLSEREDRWHRVSHIGRVGAGNNRGLALDWKDGGVMAPDSPHILSSFLALHQILSHSLSSSTEVKRPPDSQASLGLLPFHRAKALGSGSEVIRAPPVEDPEGTERSAVDDGLEHNNPRNVPNVPRPYYPPSERLDD